MGGGAPVPPAPPAKKSDVTLYDYDGTIVAGYTAAEFAEMTELPAPPEHELLTFTGWNYSLADAKAYVAKYGKISIGAVYRVTDGKTRIFITLEEGRLSPVLGLGVNGLVDVDWGDGTAHGTLTGSSETTTVFLPHTYATAGDYVIAITPGEGSTFGFVGDGLKGSLLLTKGENATGNESRVYRNVIKKFFVGDSVTSIGENAFYFCHSLTSIVIPDSVTSIGGSAFNSCHSLTSIVIPDSVTSIGGSAFNSCHGLGFIKFESTTPPTVSNANAFGNVPTDCIIYIPRGYLEAYEGATNYPDPDVYQYVEY
ncbi:MAG: leucine-rich repeat domain-containing protein [Ruminococcus sp.]|nr:leucine-rich repeat domain-containing protein [Ruminococcus sp.]